MKHPRPPKPMEETHLSPDLVELQDNLHNGRYEICVEKVAEAFIGWHLALRSGRLADPGPIPRIFR